MKITKNYQHKKSVGVVVTDNATKYNFTKLKIM